MIKKEFITSIASELENLKSEGLYKAEYAITSSQGPEVDIIDQNGDKKSVLN
ncbi:MAG: hypothetical protein ACJAZX_001551, partial [Rickettsiales bacterium]